MKIIEIVVLTDTTWTEDCEAKFRSLTAKYNSSFNVIMVDASQMENFPVATHITLPSYYNMEACRLLPKHIHKVIYLDGDMITSGSIRDVWNIDLNGYACVAVDDCSYYDQDIYKRLDYSPAQVELLQRTMTNVTRLSEKNTGNTRAIMLYYDLSFLVRDYKLETIDRIFLDLSDIISNTNVRIAQLRSQNASPELLQVEYEHIVKSYHLYAQVIDGKLNSFYALQNFLRTELQKMR